MRRGGGERDGLSEAACLRNLKYDVGDLDVILPGSNNVDIRLLFSNIWDILFHISFVY